MKATLLMSATWIVVLNALILLAHAAAHVSLYILSMTIFDDLFIGIVIMILPLVALFMIYNTHLSRWGMPLLLLTMLGSLIYFFLFDAGNGVTDLRQAILQFEAGGIQRRTSIIGEAHF